MLLYLIHGAKVWHLLKPFIYFYFNDFSQQPQDKQALLLFPFLNWGNWGTRQSPRQQMAGPGCKPQSGWSLETLLSTWRTCPCLLIPCLTPHRELQWADASPTVHPCLPWPTAGRGSAPPLSADWIKHHPPHSLWMTTDLHFPLSYCSALKWWTAGAHSLSWSNVIYSYMQLQVVKPELSK